MQCTIIRRPSSPKDELHRLIQRLASICLGKTVHHAYKHVSYPICWCLRGLATLPYLLHHLIHQRMPFLCSFFFYRSLMYMRCFVSKCHIPTYRTIPYNRGADFFLVTHHNIFHCSVVLYYRCRNGTFVVKCIAFRLLLSPRCDNCRHYHRNCRNTCHQNFCYCFIHALSPF